MSKPFLNVGKIVLLLFIAGLLVGGGIFLGKRSSPAISPTPALKIPSITPQKEQMTVPSMSPVASESATGSIKGVLGYPSEVIPPLEIYAINVDDPSKHFFVKTAANVGTFTIEDIEEGVYHVVAYPQSDSALAGGYTKAVSCGLTVECKDHSLIDVEVKPAEVTSNVEVKDWYVPEGTFPPKP